MLYQFLKRLATPFEEWSAYKLGIIDKDGNVLRSRGDLKTSEEKKAWGYFDTVIANLKKLLATVPGGKSRIGTFAAALLLMKEEREYTAEELTEEIRTLSLILTEDAPTMSTASPIAGSGPALSDVKVNKKPIKLRRKSIVSTLMR